MRCIYVNTLVSCSWLTVQCFDIDCSSLTSYWVLRNPIPRWEVPGEEVIPWLECRGPLYGDNYTFNLASVFTSHHLLWIWFQRCQCWPDERKGSDVSADCWFTRRLPCGWAVATLFVLLRTLSTVTLCLYRMERGLLKSYEYPERRKSKDFQQVIGL